MTTLSWKRADLRSFIVIPLSEIFPDQIKIRSADPMSAVIRYLHHKDLIPALIQKLNAEETASVQERDQFFPENMILVKAGRNQFLFRYEL